MKWIRPHPANPTTCERKRMKEFSTPSSTRQLKRKAYANLSQGRGPGFSLMRQLDWLYQPYGSDVRVMRETGVKACRLFSHSRGNLLRSDIWQGSSCMESLRSHCLKLWKQNLLHGIGDPRVVEVLELLDACQKELHAGSETSWIQRCVLHSAKLKGQRYLGSLTSSVMELQDMEFVFFRLL